MCKSDLSKMSTKRMKLICLSFLLIGIISLWRMINFTEHLSGQIKEGKAFSALKVSVTSEVNRNEISSRFNETLPGPGVIFTAHGGIGNQLFQYACCYAVAKKKNCPVYNFQGGRYHDGEEIFSNVSRSFTPFERNFALDKFQISELIFIDKTTVRNGSVTVLNDQTLFYRNYEDADFLELPIWSYCVSYLYWIDYKEEILSMFQLKPEVVEGFPSYVGKIAEKIMNAAEPVSVHFRGGDFATREDLQIPSTFQAKAMIRLEELLRNQSKANPTYFVFSDDPQYAKNILQELMNYRTFEFVSSGGEGSSLQDFYLMTKCKHFIVSHSTFNWWAAYLTTEGRKLKKKSKNYSTGIVIASTFNLVIPESIHPLKPRENLDFERFHAMMYIFNYYPKDWIVIDTFKKDSQSSSNSSELSVTIKINRLEIT